MNHKEYNNIIMENKRIRHEIKSTQSKLHQIGTNWNIAF